MDAEKAKIGQYEIPPWWVIKPPFVVQTSTLYSRNDNNLLLEKVEISDEEGAKANLFIKLFDPEGRTTQRNKASHLRWSQDAPHQQQLRGIYTQRFPGEPIPVLWSTAVVNQDGYPGILQEIAPQKYLSEVLKDETIPAGRRREIYFSALKQYFQYLLVVAEYASKPQVGFSFTDQKGSDFCWDENLSRLVVLDVQRTGSWEGQNPALKAINSIWCLGPNNYFFELYHLENFLNPKDFRLFEMVYRKSRAGLLETTEAISLYQDMVNDRLEVDDPRLTLSPTEEFGLDKTVWLEEWSRDKDFRLLQLALSDLSMGYWCNDLDKIRDINIENNGWRKAKTLILAMNYYRYNRTLILDEPYDEDARINDDLAIIGFKKYISGNWDKERVVEETRVKYAFIRQLEKFLGSIGVNTKIPESEKDELVSSVKEILEEIEL